MRQEPNLESGDHYEVLGCSRSSTREELTNAYRVLSRKYHPDRNPSDDEALEKFKRLGAAYTVLCIEAEDDVLDNAEGGESPLEVVMMATPTAKEVYEKQFGKLNEVYYGYGSVFGIPYATTLGDLLEESKNDIDSLSFTFCRVRFTFFRPWLIKAIMCTRLACLESICVWIALGSCVLSFLGYGDNMVLEILGGMALAVAHVILNFWYGSTRYPTIGDKDFIRWINGNQTLDDDMDEIRDTCAYYFHDCSHHTNSQTAAYITSSPFLLVEHIISLLFNSLFRLLRIGNQRDKILTDPSDTAESKSDYLLTNILRNSQSVSSLVSIAVYYATWFLGGSWYRVGTCLALMAGQSLYNAVLFRKGYFAFLQSFIFGNLFVISFVNDNLSNEKSEKMTDTESDTDDEGKSQKQAREGLVSGTTATTGNTAAAQKSAAETTSPTYNNNLILPFHIVKTTSDGHMVDAVEVGFDYRQDRSFGIERSTQFDQRLSQVPRRDVQKMTDDGKVEDRSSSSGKVDNDNDDGGIPTSISKHRYNKRRIEERFYSRKLQLLQHSAYSENVGKNLLDSSMNTESYTSPVNHDGNNKIQKRGNDGDTNLASINNNDDDDVDKGNGKNGNGVDKDMMMNVRYQNVTGAEDFDDDDSTDIGLRLDGDHMFESMSYISAPLHHQQRGEVAEHDSTSLKEEHGQEEEHNSSTLDDKEVSEYRFTMGSPKKDHSRTYTIDDDGVGAPAPAPLRITKRRRSFMKPSKLRKSKSGGSKESDGSDFSGSSLKASTRLWSFDSSILDYPQIITARINSGGAMTCLSSDDDGGSKDKENVNNDDDEENNAQAVQCDVHFPCNADDDDENDENDENKNNNIAARGHSFLNKVFDASAPLSRCSSLSAEDGLEYGERIAVDALAADEESLPHYSTLPTQLPFFPPPPPPPGPPPSSSRNKRKRRNTTTTKTGVTAPPLRITSSGKTNDGGDSVSIFSQLQHVYDSYSMW